jgi:hypothetical protein
MGTARWMAFEIHFVLTINAYHGTLEYNMFATYTLALTFRTSFVIVMAIICVLITMFMMHHFV